MTPSFFLTHRNHEDRPAVPGLRTHRLFIRREQPVRVQLAPPRLLTAAQVPRIGFLILEGCCQTGCRQGRVGRVLSDPPQQLGERLAGPRGHGRSGASFLRASATRIGSPVASQRSTWSRDAAGIAASRACCSGVKGRAGLGAGDPAGGVLIAGRAPRGPSPSFRRVGDWGCGGATTGAGAVTDSSGVKRSEADPGRGAGRGKGPGRGRPDRGVGRSWPKPDLSQGWRLGLWRYHNWGRGGNR